MRYFDAHAHIQFPEFEADREALLADMEARGIGALIVGVDAASSEAARQQASPAHGRFAAVGLHPNYVLQETFDVSTYRSFATNPAVVAIGECGLDNFRPEDTGAAKPRQQAALLEHIALAVSLNKPLMIHARPAKGTQDAYHELIDMLQLAVREHGDAVRGNIHFFVGGIDEARALFTLGFTVSYTAVLTFTHDYDEVVRYAPLTSLLTETDSPYAAPPPKRGTRNDPRSVERVVAAIAAIKNESEEAVRIQVLKNAEHQFGISLQ